jgi:hypothetical protein
MLVVLEKKNSPKNLYSWIILETNMEIKGNFVHRKNIKSISNLIISIDSAHKSEALPRLHWEHL